jgi:hypothetical protein
MVHCNWRETGTLRPHTFVGHEGQCASMHWILWAVNHKSALFDTSLQQGFFMMQYDIHCMKVSCTLSVYNQYIGCSQERNISSSPLSFCAIYYALTRQYVQEVVYAIYTTCIYGQCKILMLIITPHSSKIFSVKIWAGIIDDHIIGPYVIQNDLSGVRCASFLEETLLLAL